MPDRLSVIVVFLFILHNPGASSLCSPKTYTLCKDEFIPSFEKHFTVSIAKTGSSYANDLNCYQLINHQIEPFVLVLYFTRFDVEFQENCEYDSLKLAGQKFCGNWLQEKTLKMLIKPYRMVEFHFSSDATNAGAGFSVNVDIIPYFQGETIFEYDGPGSRYKHAYVVSTSVPNGVELSNQEDNFLAFLHHASPPSLNRTQASTSRDDHMTAPNTLKETKVKNNSRWFDLY